MCSNVMPQDTKSNSQNRSPTRIDPRRNSVPPTQTLKAKHLLAYLPRSPDSVCNTSSPNKTVVKSTMADILSTRVPLIPSLSCSNQNSPASALSLKTFPSLQTQNPCNQCPRGLTNQDTPCCYSIHAAPFEPIEETEKPRRSHRSRHLKRFSSKWYASSQIGGSNISIHANGAMENMCIKKTIKKHCKLLGDEQPSYGTASNQRQRYVTKDGKCRVNLGPIEDKSRFISDIFTTLVDLKYRWFLFVFTMCYILTWVAFAAIYFLDAWLRDDLSHVADPQWQPCFDNVDSFLSALLLSVESQRTIGYGSRMVTANCPEGVMLLMAQSILGSIIDALMVGCMFVKISRPQKRAQTLIFGKHCVISERDEKLCLLFRIGDLRESHMVDAKIRAKLIKSRQTKEGEFIPLEQSEINLGYDTGGDRLLLVEPQTITHIINESSPFWEVGAERLRRETLEIIIILEGIVEASGMTCQARTSYTEDEILWGHRFESCMSLEKGAFRVDNSAFDKTFEVQMSPLSAKDRSTGQDQQALF
ncbi:G protein-activated inward rectifier potassium channel 3-like [Lampris incognitus]|uniref:G protein-activated inward rectifier potassium channel 3-like n=1 Tax=Lampris incognitus TaxID=2546036 RepID=UPI0024B4D2CC|nr:G protein-activated inward rectifier potassium channel 3-like [Lampris incognitus]